MIDTIIDYRLQHAHNELLAVEGNFLENQGHITHASPGTAQDSLIQALHKCLIVSVGRHVGGNATTDGHAQKIEVSNQVQYLVAHEFVGIPSSVLMTLPSCIIMWE